MQEWWAHYRANAEVSDVTRHHVILYVAPNSEESNRARHFLHEHDVTYKEKDIGGDPGARGELLHKTGSTRVPAIDVDGHVVVGFDDFLHKWRHLLEADALTSARPDDSPPGDPQVNPRPD